MAMSAMLPYKITFIVKLPSVYFTFHSTKKRKNPAKNSKFFVDRLQYTCTYDGMEEDK